VDDIIPLAENFISDQNIKFRKNINGMDKLAQKRFLQYGWTGNVRELRNAIERAMIFEDESVITSKHLSIQPKDYSSS
jgi:two-component system response regulator AtoC